MSLLHEALDACAALTRRVEHLEHDKVAQALEIIKLKKRVKKLERANKGRMIADLDRDTGVALMDDEGIEKKAKNAQVAGDEQLKGRQAEIYQIDMDHAAKVLRMQEDEPEVQEVVDVVTTAKLITEVVVAVSESVTAASATIANGSKRGIICKMPAETKSKDKKKGKMVEEPKPMKKKQQVEMDEEYARKLHEKLNQDIDWSVAIDHVKQKAKEDPYVQRYQVMKKRPQTEAQAQRNMIMYLKNTVGFKLDYFKGMSYDDIRLNFEAKYNSNIELLLKSKEQIEEEENRAIKSINETPAQKAAKRRKMNEDVEDLKQHLEIVPDEDDDCTHHIIYNYSANFASRKKIPTLEVYTRSNATVRIQVEEQSEMSLELLSGCYTLKITCSCLNDVDEDLKDLAMCELSYDALCTHWLSLKGVTLLCSVFCFIEATPLAKKIPVVDYQIIQLNNKPRYKIIRADGTHQLYVSFITLLKNFDKEYLESLWSIVKERFFTSKPNNFFDDYLLTTLRAMFERPDGQDQVWKSQRSVHGQTMVKS
nr:hypothetical protein [Tanacetum cinerariifolium]GEY74179.1 hypothetical protein [Tanacetum cinerariifolium]